MQAHEWTFCLRSCYLLSSLETLMAALNLNTARRNRWSRWKRRSNNKRSRGRMKQGSTREGTEEGERGSGETVAHRLRDIIVIVITTTKYQNRPGHFLYYVMWLNGHSKPVQVSPFFNPLLFAGLSILLLNIYLYLRTLSCGQWGVQEYTLCTVAKGLLLGTSERWANRMIGWGWDWVS